MSPRERKGATNSCMYFLIVPFFSFGNSYVYSRFLLPFFIKKRG